MAAVAAPGGAEASPLPTPGGGGAGAGPGPRLQPQEEEEHEVVRVRVKVSDPEAKGPGVAGFTGRGRKGEATGGRCVPGVPHGPLGLVVDRAS